MQNNKNVLIVDMDAAFVDVIGNQLEAKHFTVHTARDAYSAQAIVKQVHIHAALVSVNLFNAHDSNDWSGIELALNLSSYTRVVMTAHKPTVEMVRLALATRLNSPAPAHDFVRKEEGIEAIVTALYKVMNLAADAVPAGTYASAISSGSKGTAASQKGKRALNWHPQSTDHFALDHNTRLAVVNGDNIPLSEREYRILAYFMDHSEMVVSREDIVSRVLDEVYDSQADCNRVNNIISRLRKSIEPDPQHPRFIITRWGSGWMFYPNADAPDMF